MDRYMPPRDAKRPLSPRAISFTFVGFSPTDLAALLFSPTARILSPRGIRYIRNQTTMTRMNAT